ncbi:MAG: RdgB/HAM1 family non-canonical purine NTP pyrophosphatase [Bacteroidetes bacterium]|nr:RdgB/HAM1 family non-canonical purine NTP pyrophosphatase [Bacteroidota bacterium]
MKKKVVFATRNKNKILEIQKLLPDTIDVIGLEEIHCYEELPETHDTIEANSLEKAEYVYHKYHVDCFAEDSGLEVEVLNGAPGVDSAYYSGSRNPSNNIALVLNELGTTENRKARFKTVFTFKNAYETRQFSGIMTGDISLTPRGSSGFGYDPIFVPTGYLTTFAEMQPLEKIVISHRTKAFNLLKEYLKKKVYTLNIMFLFYSCQKK